MPDGDVRDVSDKDLALYRAIVGGGRGATPDPPPPPVRRLQALGPRIQGTLRLARRRLAEGLRRLDLRRIM
jgi:hypothetical protein